MNERQCSNIPSCNSGIATWITTGAELFKDLQLFYNLHAA